MSEHSKLNIKKAVIVVLFLLSIFVFALSYNAGNNQTGSRIIHPITRFKATQDFNFTIVPENFTDDFAEMFIDILWDIDGDAGFDGIFPLVFSYIPFLGSNGTVFTDIIFILSISLGAIFLAKRIRG